MLWASLRCNDFIVIKDYGSDIINDVDYIDEEDDNYLANDNDLSFLKIFHYDLQGVEGTFHLCHQRSHL